MTCSGCFAQEPVLGPTGSTRIAAVPGTAELFYEVLLGEMSTANGNPSAGYSFLLDAARRSGDAALFKRAIDVAVQARSGDAALIAAKAWRDAQPDSREANRYVLRLLVELNRIEETAEPLKKELALTPMPAKVAVLTAVPALFDRVADKREALTVVQQALSAEITEGSPTASAALTALGRVHMAAGDGAGALTSARRAQALDPHGEAAALLGLELLDKRVPGAEDIVRTYLAGQPETQFRMTYARVLIDLQRYADAAEQMQIVTHEKPEMPEAWLIQGTLQLQNGQNDVADKALQRYLALAQDVPESELKTKGMTQAYLLLSQIAEKRKDYVQAEAWLNRIEDAEELFSAQARRASVLATQGKVPEARALLRNLPERTATAARMKVLAEAQLLRDQRDYRAANDVIESWMQQHPDDVELRYDQAMIVEKMGDVAGMERLLREVIARKPTYHNAYNALGYSLADRGVQLDEAKALIQKALEYAPADPFISDSLAWVEFRLGNRTEALRILEAAFRTKPDAEIAAHLGEVLWSLGQQDRAASVWREGLALNAENETLIETIRRFRIRP